MPRLTGAGCMSTRGSLSETDMTSELTEALAQLRRELAMVAGGDHSDARLFRCKHLCSSVPLPGWDPRAARLRSIVRTLDDKNANSIVSRLLREIPDVMDEVQLAKAPAASSRPC